MKKLVIRKATEYVEKNIEFFHEKKISRIKKLKLSSVLKRKNPYLFRAKNVLTAEQIVKGIVDAHISSNEETLFGDWLEGLAIFVNEKAYNGWKSGIEGIDLEFDNNDTRYIVSIKSGPNWGNSGQINKMIADFNRAKKTLLTSNSGLRIEAVNGCCYGKDGHPYKEKGYFKYCGQYFWEFISGDTNLYTDIVEPLGYKAKERNYDFDVSYAQIINKFTIEFANDFCSPTGSIDWKKLVEFNSAK